MPQRKKGTKHKVPKFKLLLDENLPPRKTFRRLNSRFSVKHVVHDYKRERATDPEVHKLAVEENRLIVTFNDKDFKDLAEKSKSSGIIGVSTNLSYEQIDIKITALLNKSTKNQLFGRFIYLSGEDGKK